MNSLQFEQKMARVEEEPLPIFPPEIITEIASRLPAKSLARFKTVSKPWLDMISDPKFVKLHLNRTKALKICFASNIVVYSSAPESLSNGFIISQKIKNYPLPKPDPDRWIHLLGSANGLICISIPLNGSNCYYIYNPTTGHSKQMPDAMPRVKFLGPPDICGFGYSSALDDYKFIKVAHGKQIEVYSLKNDTWKLASDEFPYNLPYAEPGTPLNGSIHWVQSRGTLDNRLSTPTIVMLNNEDPFIINVRQSEEQRKLPYHCVVAAFDLAEEKFVDIPVPNPDLDYRDYSLGLLDGKLCLTHDNGGLHNEFWIMKEYGVKESWNRMVISFRYSTLRPVCFAEDGDRNGALMVINQNRLVLMNLESGTGIDLRVRKMRGTKFESDVIQETLVSPDSL